MRNPFPKNKWTRPGDYGPGDHGPGGRHESGRARKPALKVVGGDGSSPRRGAKWFWAALVVLPLAAFGAVFFWPSPGSDSETATATATAPAPITGPERPAAISDSERAHFTLCSGPVRVTCVVDGDTIWYRGEKIRLVGFDTPEVSNPGCAREAELGAAATRRLQQWLNKDAFTLGPNPEGRARDRYGRALLVASRGGANVSDVLLAEGLAERRGGRRNAWC